MKPFWSSRTHANDPILDLVARGLGAAVAALLSSLAYPPRDFSAMAIFGLSVLLIAIFRCAPGKAAWIGGIYGLTCTLIALSWLGSGPIQYWLTASLIMGVLMALFSAAAAVLSYIPWWPIWTASTFAVVDLVQGIIDVSAVTTMRAVYTQSDTILFNASALAGSVLVSFTVALIAGLLAALIIRLITGEGSIFWLLGLSAINLCVIILVALIPTSPSPQPSGDFKILAVQPSTASGLKMGRGLSSLPGEIGASLQWLRSYASQYPFGGAEKPDLAVIPMRSTTERALKNPSTVKAISATSRQLGSPILLGYSTGPTPDFGYSRFSLWNGEGEITNFAVYPNGYSPIDSKITPTPPEENSELLHIISVNGNSVGVVEATQVFESIDEMPNLTEAQYLLVMRPDIGGEEGRVVSQNLLTSTRVLAANTQRPALVLGERGPSGFITSQGVLAAWASRDRPGYIFKAQPVDAPGALPQRRDSIVFLLFLILPIAALISSLYLRRHPILSRKFSFPSRGGSDIPTFVIKS